FGFQNSFMLIAVPFAIFGSSILVTVLGTSIASWILFGLWIVMTIVALTIRPMKQLDDPEEQSDDTEGQLGETDKQLKETKAKPDTPSSLRPRA
ncbi:MAG: phage scaffolding protein, partial [Coriobacteriia bacterium]|nr:phage scaffolding protein [Coriobacteriia bacterium]